MRSRLLTSTLLAMAVGQMGYAQPQPDLSIGNAHRAHYLGHYEQALTLYEKLAAAGNAEAAERAGLMLLLGTARDGRAAPRDADRANALLIQAARAGRPAAGVVLNLLDGTD